MLKRCQWGFVSASLPSSHSAAYNAEGKPKPPKPSWSPLCPIICKASKGDKMLSRTAETAKPSWSLKLNNTFPTSWAVIEIIAEELVHWNVCGSAPKLETDKAQARKGTLIWVFPRKVSGTSQNTMRTDRLDLSQIYFRSYRYRLKLFQKYLQGYRYWLKWFQN